MVINMSENEKRSSFRVLFLITTPKLSEKAVGMFRKGAVPILYQWNAVGTAPNEMIDILGLGSPDKSILLSILPKHFADAMLKKLKKELRLGAVNSGIAFTLPLSGANKLMLRMVEQLNEVEINTERKDKMIMSDTKYSIIVATVNQGFSGEVMDAARKAGAGGGTVVPSRCIGNEEAMGFWGISVQEEKDMVFIVAEEESKLAIMQAIGETCGVHSAAKGLIVSLPIDTVIGLE